MVRAFAHAGTVRLGRCLRRKFPGETDDPELDSYWQAQHRARITDMLAAVAGGSAASRGRGGCPVHALDLSGVGLLLDSHVDQICRIFNDLRCVHSMWQ